MKNEIVKGIVRQLEGSMQIPLVKATIKVVGDNGDGFRVPEPDEEKRAETAKILFQKKVKPGEPIEVKETVRPADPKKDGFTVKESQKKAARPIFVKKQEAKKSLVEESPKIVPSVENLPRSISKISNMIGNYLHEQDVHESCRSHIRGKMFADEFYRRVQNCVYKSLTTFCQMEVNADKSVNLPDPNKVPDNVLSTLIFFDRIYNDRSVSFEKDPNKVMQNYRDHFEKDGTDGIHPEWIDDLRKRMEEKITMGTVGIQNVIDTIKGMWTAHFYPNVITTVSDETAYEVSRGQSKSVNHPEDEGDGVDGISIHVGFGRGDEHDIIKIHAYDDDGLNIYPFYEHLGEINLENIRPHKHNGYWNFLKAFIPNMIFTTKNPEPYLKFNEIPLEESNMRCIVVDAEEVGVPETKYHIGVYMIDGVYRHAFGEGESPVDASDLDELIQLIDVVVHESDLINNQTMARLGYSNGGDSLYQDEKDIVELFNHIEEGDDDREEEIDESEDREESIEEFSEHDNEDIEADSSWATQVDPYEEYLARAAAEPDDPVEEDLTDIAMRSLVGDSEPDEEILEDEDIPDDSQYDAIEDDEEAETIASIGGENSDDAFVFQPVRRKH